MREKRRKASGLGELAFGPIRLWEFVSFKQLVRVDIFERFVIIIVALISLKITQSSSSLPGYHNGFQLYAPSNELAMDTVGNNGQQQQQQQQQQHQQTQTSNQTISCPNGLLTFELSTGFIYKPASAETLAMMPSTLQLTDCLDYCLQNSSCLAINFEMGLCVLLSSSAKQNPHNLYSSQFPVFTIYAEKKCLLAGDGQVSKQRRRCQRAWTFERVAGYEMKTRPRRRLKVASKEHCMEACLGEREFECRSANWYRQTGECTLNDQDRHSVSQSEAGDQQIKTSLADFYGPSNLTGPPAKQMQRPPPSPSGLYQNYYTNGAALFALRRPGNETNALEFGADEGLARGRARRQAGESQAAAAATSATSKYRNVRQLFTDLQRIRMGQSGSFAPVRAQNGELLARQDWLGGLGPSQYVDMPAFALVDYLENNCIYEPNKLCEFRKIQNRILKTVDSIYQEVASLDECKQKCLNAPYRCYSFDYGDTSERVCRTSHLDQASLLSVKEPYLEVVGAITYELASCFNVTIQCRAREMVAMVSSSKSFKGKIYAKSRPSSCVNDVRESLQFELQMRYHDPACDVRSTSTSQQGVFSNDIVIQHHDRIVTTQDVGLSVYCQYDLGNRSITNNVDLAIERIEEPPMESKTSPGGQRPAAGESGSVNSPLTITSLATTVVRSPNVTMRITNMNGQPVRKATVGDRLALLFEIKEKSSPFGIFVREIIAMDGKQLMAANNNNNGNKNNNNDANLGGYHYAPGGNGSSLPFNENNVESLFQANKANSVQFIDSDGCPTDANIMGPLVKMDPTGHRVLAPFDAFKFPTSDMVFFRAVVTSCVSECKPVICSPSQQGDLLAAAASSTNPTLGPTLAESLASTSSSFSPTTTTTTTTGRPGELGSSSTRNLPARNSPSGSLDQSSGGRMTTIAMGSQPTSYLQTQMDSHANLSTTGQYMDPTSLLSAASSHLHPQHMTPLPMAGSTGWSRWPTAHQATTSDLLGQRFKQRTQPATSAADFQRTTSSQMGDSLTTVPGFGTQELWLPEPNSNQLEQPNLINMTNNHQLGKAPARLTTLAPADSIGEHNGATLRPVNLELMSEEQKLQIVKLFETKLKQPGPSVANNGSLADMADLYTGFLTSLMLKGSSAKQGAGGGQQGDENYKRHEGAQRPLGESAPAAPVGVRLADFEGFLSYLLSEAKANRADQRMAALIQALEQQQQQQQQQVAPNKLYEQDGANLHGDRLKHPAIGSPLSGNYLDTHTDLSNSSAQPPAKHSSLYQAAPVGLSEPELANVNPNQIRSHQTQQQASAGKTSVAKMAAAVNKPNNEKQRKKDKANLQALADSYMGAYQSYGRRKRQVGQPEELLAPAYAYVSQPQWATLAPSVARSPEPARFTRGVVEMYHTDWHQQSRHKRDTAPQPSYDTEELVIQSIKIVDRLQFQEEPLGTARGLQSRTARGSLVTGAQQLAKSQGRQNLTVDQFDIEAQSGASADTREWAAQGDGSSGSDGSDQDERRNLVRWSSWGSLSLVMIALAFIFLQILLVLVFFLSWDRRQTRPRLASRQRREQLDAGGLSRGSPDGRGSLSTLSSSSSFLAGPARRHLRACHQVYLSPASCLNGRAALLPQPPGRPGNESKQQPNLAYGERRTNGAPAGGCPKSGRPLWPQWTPDV